MKTQWHHDIGDILKLYYHVSHELALFEDVCGTRVFIPKSLQHRVIKVAQDGHAGIVKMNHWCRKTVWWPGIDTRIKEMVKSLVSCRLSKK